MELSCCRLIRGIGVRRADGGGLPGCRQVHRLRPPDRHRVGAQRAHHQGGERRADGALIHNTASSPLRSSRLSNFSDGPLGCFSPISHLRTVDGLVLSTEASTV